MPTNMYGPNDNFDLATCHVLPALINRFVNAEINGENLVTLWGTGLAKREFMHVDDFASAVFIAAEKYDDGLQMNVGTGEDLTIAELATVVAQLSGYKGEIEWDSSKPDGTPRKVLDVTKMKNLGWAPAISLEAGISSTIEWFKENSMAKR